MPEKFSSFDRVVGNIPESAKERILREQEEIFDDQSFTELEDIEIEITPEQLEMISIANNATNEILRKYGREDFDIPANNIHVVGEENWPRKTSGAIFSPTRHAVAIREAPGKISFVKKVFHEMLHFKSYNALQVTHGEESKLANYRGGLIVHSRDGKKMYLENLNEAVTEEITMQFVKNNLRAPYFIKEFEETQRLMSSYPNAVSYSGEPMFGPGTFYADMEKKTWGEAIGRLFGTQEKNKKIISEEATYKRERKILNILIDKLFIRNPDKFKYRAEVLDVFCKGMITGNILPLGRLVDGTFSPGVLRSIGELDNDIEKQEEFVNSL